MLVLSFAYIINFVTTILIIQSRKALSLIGELQRDSGLSKTYIEKRIKIGE